MELNTYTHVQGFGNKIFHRGRDVETSKRFEETILDYRPTLFVGSSKENTEWHTIKGENVESVQPGSIKDARQFIENHKDVEGFHLYGNERFLYQFLSDTYPEVMPISESKLSIVTIDIECASGLEGFPNASDAQYPILLITLRKNDQYYTFGTGYYKTENPNVHYTECTDEKELLTKFMDCWAELDIDIITGWSANFFDIPYLISRIEKILGEKKSRGLSPFNIILENEELDHNKVQKVFSIAGISILDYLALYRKFTYTMQESYRLDNIALVELGEKKLDFSEYRSLHNLYQQNWQKFVDYNLKDVELVYRLNEKLNLISLAIELAYVAKINFEDVFSPIRVWDALIYDRLKKQHIAVPLTTRGDKDHEIAGAYVKEPRKGLHKWVVNFDENSLYPSIISSLNLSPDTVVDGETVEKITSINRKCLGSHLGFGQPELEGISESQYNTESSYIVDLMLSKKLDLTPWTSKNYTVAVNGHCYRRDKRGIIPTLMDEFYAKRASCKKEMIVKQKEYEQTKNPQTKIEISVLDVRQQAFKIAMNSAYGILTNPYFRFFDNRIAEAVTLTGQFIIRWMGNAFDVYLNKLFGTTGIPFLVYSDTDSIYLSLDIFLKKLFGDKVLSNEQIRSYLSKCCEGQFSQKISLEHAELCKYLNVYKNNFGMKREIIADKAIFIAKKKYILNVLDKEGVIYAKPKAVIHGIEVVRSSTPQKVRDNLRKAIDIILNGTQNELHDFVVKFREEFMKLRVEEIASPRGVNGIIKYTGKGDEKLYSLHCPIHTRGAILYNDFIKKNKLTNKYPIIQDGEKVKFVYLKLPNPMRENIISFPDDRLPEEMKLQNSIDYALQFEKTFLDPLQSVLSTIQWTTERVTNLEDLFG